MKDGLGDLIAHMDVESNKVDKRVKPASSQLSAARNTTDSDIGSYLSYKETEKPSIKRKVNTTNKILLCVYCNAHHYTSECDRYNTLAARVSLTRVKPMCAMYQ